MTKHHLFTHNKGLNYWRLKASLAPSISFFHNVSADAIAVTKTQTYGIGIGNIYFDEVRCLGNESNITECRHAGEGIHNCEHLEDAAVLCRRKQNNYIYTSAFCTTRLSQLTHSNTCLHLTANAPPKVCEDGQIRLIGGRTATRADGRVEICFNDRWGTVCDDNFGVQEAAVVCRQQGFPAEGLYYTDSELFYAPVILLDVTYN